MVLPTPCGLTSAVPMAQWVTTNKAAIAGAKDTTISGISQTVFDMENCLQGTIGDIATLSTTDATAQMDVENLKQKIAEEKDNIAVAAERLNIVKAPTTSFYESWFPMQRPLRPSSTPVLIGLSVFMALMAVGYALAAGDIYVLVYSKGAGNMMDIAAIKYLLSQFTMAFWIVLVALISVILYFVYKDK